MDSVFYKSADAKVASDSGTISGYASTFDREPDSYGDVVAKGAFVDSLAKWAESGHPIPLLFGHRTDDPKYNIGHVTEIHEDERGLFFTAEFDPDNETAQYVRKLAIEGRLCKFSFAYGIVDAAPVELDGGASAQELRKLDIYEISVVQIPANEHTEVTDVKTAEPSIKAGRRNSKADEDIMREIRAHLAGALELIEKLDIADEPDPEPDADATEGVDEEESEGGEADASAKGREDEAEILVEYKEAIRNIFKIREV